jgi:FKBP-type peptidyl-prolyl cis-trans isomerase
MRSSLLALLFALSAFALPHSLQAQREKLPDEDLEFVQQTWPHAKKLFTGIRYLVLDPGEGPPPKEGALVQVLYSGCLLSEYEKNDDHPKPFDKAEDPRHPLELRVGRSQVIEGWDEVLQVMRPGGKYLVIIPSELAYGSRGQPPLIPRDATLVFTMEILAIKKD